MQLGSRSRRDQATLLTLRTPKPSTSTQRPYARQQSKLPKPLSPCRCCGFLPFPNTAIQTMSSCEPQRRVVPGQGVPTTSSFRSSQANARKLLFECPLSRPFCSLLFKCCWSQKVCHNLHQQPPSPTSVGHCFKYIHHIQPKSIMTTNACSDALE